MGGGKAMTSIFELLIATGVLAIFGLLIYGSYMHEIQKDEERKNDK